MSFPALQGGWSPPTDTEYQQGAEYLRSLGIDSKGELMRILDVAMNPNSLFGRYRDKKRAVNASVSESTSTFSTDALNSSKRARLLQCTSNNSRSTVAIVNLLRSCHDTPPCGQFMATCQRTAANFVICTWNSRDCTSFRSVRDRFDLASNTDVSVLSK